MKKLILLAGLLGFWLAFAQGEPEKVEAATYGGGFTVVNLQSSPQCPGGKAPQCAVCNWGCKWACAGDYYCTIYWNGACGYSDVCRTY